MITLAVGVTGISSAANELNRAQQMDGFRDAMYASLRDIAGYMEPYPPPPAAIQGPAHVPVRTFTTKAGQTVRIRASKMAGKGISMAKASSLRYKRTGKLGQRWTREEAIKIVVSGNSITGTLTNNIDYGPYVQAAATQAGIHQGRWQTDRMAVDQLRDRIVTRFQVAARGTSR